MARKRTGVITEDLEHLLRLQEELQGKPVEKRISMLVMLKKEPQRPLEEIALLVGIPAPTIKRWWRIYRGGGIDALAHPNQRKRRSEDQVFADLKKKLANAELQSLDDVRAWLDVLDRSDMAPDPERAQPRQANSPRARGSGRRTPPAAEQAESKVSPAILRFLTSLPLELDTVPWIRQISKHLREFLGDVDRISIVANVALDLQNPDKFLPRMLVVQGPDYKEGVVKTMPIQRRETDGAQLQRYLEGAPTDIDMAQYHPPISFGYYYSEAYVGMIILWRRCSEPPISEQTLRLMDDLYSFFLFLMTDVIARNRVARPASVFFVRAWSDFINMFGLTPPEQRTLMHLLFGYTYKDIARLINLSENTVRYHIKSIYAKAGVHSQAELFARYFTAKVDSE